MATLVAIVISGCIVATLPALASIPRNTGFDAAATVGLPPSAKTLYRSQYFANADYFIIPTLTGDIIIQKEKERSQEVTADVTELHGAVDALPLSPLLTGSLGVPGWRKAARDNDNIGGMTGDAASGDRRRVASAFRSRGLLVGIFPEEIVDIVKECSLILPEIDPIWNLSASAGKPAPKSSVRLVTLEKILRRFTAYSEAPGDVLMNILESQKAHNGDNKYGTSDPNTDTMLLPISLVLLSHPNNRSQSDYGGSQLLRLLAESGLSSPSAASDITLSCLLEQIRRNPALYSESPLPSSVVSSIVFSDLSFVESPLLSRAASDHSTSRPFSDDELREYQHFLRVIRERLAYDFYPQISAIIYFRTNSGIEKLASLNPQPSATNSNFNRFLASIKGDIKSIGSAVFGEYLRDSRKDFSLIEARALFNRNEVLLSPINMSSYRILSNSPSMRPGYTIESNANMFMSSNAIPQYTVPDPLMEANGVSTLHSVVGNAIALSQNVHYEQRSVYTNANDSILEKKSIHSESIDLLDSAISERPFSVNHHNIDGDFYTKPNCMEADSVTCAPIGGLSIWATTCRKPSTLKGLDKRFTSDGSIAIVVPASITAMLHQSIPGATTISPDITTGLAIIDALAKSVLYPYLYNSTFIDELVKSTGNAGEKKTSDDILGHLYFFFFSGEEFGFAGSGRMVKDIETFNCTKKGTDESDLDGTSCQFPFYWFTNFTDINLVNIRHFIALENVLDTVEIEKEVMSALKHPAYVPKPPLLYAYTDKRVALHSPYQQHVNSYLKSIPNFINITIISDSNMGESVLAKSNVTTIGTTLPKCSLYTFMASSALIGKTNGATLPIEWQKRSFTLFTSAKKHDVSHTKRACSSADTLDNYLLSQSSASTLYNVNYNISYIAGLRYAATIRALSASAKAISLLVADIYRAEVAQYTTNTDVISLVPSFEEFEDRCSGLWYKLAGNINHNIAASMDVKGNSPLPQPDTPNYYTGVFSYYSDISSVQQAIYDYISERVDYNVNDTAHRKYKGQSSDSTASFCLPDNKCQTRNEVCLPLILNKTKIFRCVVRQTFFSHSFGMGATYNPLYPNYANYVVDNKWFHETGEGNWSLQAFALMHANIITVESVWSNGGFGVRTGMYFPPDIHYILFSIGVLTFIFSMVVLFVLTNFFA
eukprot:Tbor_TRINITY_DN5362_c6_g1::TRINITY_DN5362_c6_g1_i1::g.5046::m.5046